MLCGSVLYISLHHLNPSAMLDPNAFAFRLAPLCPGPIVGGSWCQEQGPGKPWRFLVISCEFRCDPYDPSMKCASASNARDLGTIERLQGFDSQAFFHGRPFARESLQPP